MVRFDLLRPVLRKRPKTSEKDDSWKCANIISFLTISSYGKLGSLIRLLRYKRSSTALLLSTDIIYFRKTESFDFKRVLMGTFFQGKKCDFHFCCTPSQLFRAFQDQVDRGMEVATRQIRVMLLFQEIFILYCVHSEEKNIF